MTEIAETKIDKSSWGEGPWQHEPDRKEWRDAATDLPCLAVRHDESGHWCGYVGVTEGHPAYHVHYDGVTPEAAKRRSARVMRQMRAVKKLTDGGVSYGDAIEKVWGKGASSEPEIVCDLSGISVHGGLTYAAECSGRVFHTPAPGETDKVWWFGFDCAHCDDLSPGTRALLRSLGHDREVSDVYRTLEYVEFECTSLARQLAEMQKA